ncbi:uncharacterized protein LOC134094191 [Sardina pilchardus]|uniref:uncharacterized protein LOC134094191 n=1 Tax=Sardina pilchardus TaxID=27697 RepID=UPI002E11D65F
MASSYIASLTEDRQKTLLLNKEEHLTCYQLLTEREYLDGDEWVSQIGNKDSADSLVRRRRFGKVNPEKMSKTILIVGETGTGKTTLINTMVNYILGVKFEDKVWFEITEEVTKSQAESQTSAITVYTVNTDGPTSLNIIDTPGFGATGPKGKEKDEKIAKDLLTLFSSYAGIERLASVGLVVKESQNRLTAAQQYIFDAILSIFGKNLESNIVVFITYSHGDHPDDALNAVNAADTPCARTPTGDPVHFLFNNGFPKKLKNIGAHPQKKYKKDWCLGENSMTDFLTFLDQTEEKSLRMTEDVLRQRGSLEACVINLQQRIAKEEAEQKILKDIEAILLTHKEKLDNNENFEIEVDELYIDAVAIKTILKQCNENATRCENCKENCHFPGCTLVSKDMLWMCQMMKRSNGDYLCKVCTGHCSYRNHTKDDKMFVQVTRKVKKTADNLRKEYEEKYGKDVDMKARTEEILLQSKNLQGKLVDECYDHIMCLQNISLKKEPQSIVVLLDGLITRLKENGQHEKANNLEEIRNRVPPVNPATQTFYKCLTSIRHTFEEISVTKTKTVVGAKHK